MKLNSFILLASLHSLLAFASAAPPATKPSEPPSLPPLPPIVQLPPGQDHVTIKLYTGGDLYFTRVKINGVDAGWFAIDTGTTCIVLDERLAQRLGFHSVAKTSMGTPDHTTVAAIFDVPSMQVGPVRIGRDFAGSVDFTKLSKHLGVEISGALGMTFFREHPSVLDFQSDELTLYDRSGFRAPPVASFRLMSRREQMGYIEGRVDSGPTGLFMLDTGETGGPTLFNEFYGLNTSTLGHAGVGRTWTVDAVGGSKTLLYAINIAALGRSQICFASVSNTRHAVDDGGSSAGVIGIDFLHDVRLTLDCRGGRVWAQWPNAETAAEMLKRLHRQEDQELAGTTALMRAAKAGRNDVVDALLAEGAQVNAVSKWGMTALREAGHAGSLPIIRTLIAHHADVDAAVPFDGSTVLMKAAQSGQSEIVKALLDAGASVKSLDILGRTALHIAVEAKQPGIALALLKAGADPDLPDAGGAAPLILAAVKNEPTMVALLLDHHAAMNVRDRHGIEALEVAAHFGSYDVAQLLLKRGAKIDSRDSQGATALIAASQAGKARVVQLLLDHGADFTIRNNESKTAKDYSAAVNLDSFALLQMAEDARKKKTP